MNVKQTYRSNLLQLADIKSDADGTSRASMARAALNDNTFFRRLERDENFTFETCDKVLAWFSDNWPDGAEWPADVPRPTPAEPATEATS